MRRLAAKRVINPVILLAMDQSRLLKEGLRVRQSYLLYLAQAASLTA